MGQTRRVEFVYLKIPASQDSPPREHQLHAALENALIERALGGLVGWGDSVEGAGPGRRLTPAFHRIDIEVTDLQAALAALKACLATLGVPQRSELHYTLGGQALQEVYGAEGWSTRQPTTATTPHRGGPKPAP